MAQVSITVYRCIQDSQEFGSDAQHMISRMFLRISVDDAPPIEANVDIKQIVGGDFETDPLEVGGPRDYRGPMDHAVFSAELESLYRSLVGRTGAIRITSGRMYNNILNINHSFAFDAPSSPGGW